jgi:hypothetical protein
MPHLEQRVVIAMDSRFLELCGREFERQVERMFDNAPRIPGTGLGEIPVVGGRFFLAFATPPELIELVCMALAARERFRWDVPGWPTLPLHEDTIEAMQADGDNRCSLVGFYADSLQGEFWDYELHPRFPIFASGLLSCKNAPDHLRNDHSLLKEFAPAPLAGLCDDDWLVWRSPQRLAERQKHLALVAAHKAAMGAAPPPHHSPN